MPLRVRHPLQIPWRLLPSQLPELLCKGHGWPSIREQSFKLELGGGLQNQRHILAFPARLLSEADLKSLVRDFAMPIQPELLTEQLVPQLQRASTVYLGHEHALGGASHRLYFEYWDALVERLQAMPAQEIAAWRPGNRPLWEMGVGYKWPIGREPSSEGSGALYTSRYLVRPLLPQAEMLTLAQQMLRIPAMPVELRERLMSVLKVIAQREPDLDPVFLEVLEPHSLRCSFDLCVHRYNLRLRDLEPWLTALVRWFLGERFSLVDCVGSQGMGACMTHISSGCTRRGLPYACVYYVLEEF